MLAKLLFAFALFVFLVDAQTTLNLGSTIEGSVLARASDKYSFSYSNPNTGNGYQYVVVVPEIGQQGPTVSIAGQSITQNAQVQCSAAASSVGGQVSCSYAFSACVTTGAPQAYTITVRPPALTAFANFSISALGVNAVVTAAASTVANLPVCCGVTGVSWVYINAGAADVLESITITLSNGNLTTSNLLSGNIALPPGVYLIPATSVCTNFNPLTVTQQLLASLTASASFSQNLNGDSSTTSITLNLSVKTPGASFYALVVSGSDSSAQFQVAAQFQGQTSGSNSASSLSPFWW